MIGDEAFRSERFEQRRSGSSCVHLRRIRVNGFQMFAVGL